MFVAKRFESAASLYNILLLKESVPHTIVSYFYMDFNDPEKQSSRKAIRSLLFQCALQANGILHDLEQLYQNCRSGQQQPAEDAIQSLFQEAMARPGEKYIVLDALDECTDREQLLPFMRELITSRSQKLRILVTSRREKDIEDVLGQVAIYNINIQSNIVDADISVYICDQMATDTKLKKWPDSVKNQILTELMAKAGGM